MPNKDTEWGQQYSCRNRLNDSFCTSLLMAHGRSQPGTCSHVLPLSEQGCGEETDVGHLFPSLSEVTHTHQRVNRWMPQWALPSSWHIWIALPTATSEWQVRHSLEKCQIKPGFSKTQQLLNLTETITAVDLEFPEKLLVCIQKSKCVIPQRNNDYKNTPTDSLLHFILISTLF